MNAKKITLMVNLSRFGEYRAIPDDADLATRTQLIAHNMQVTLLRALLAERIKASAESLAFKVHVGAHAVLLRGIAERIEDIDIPDCIETCDVREASERWNPRHS